MLSRRDQIIDEGKTEIAEESYLIKCDQTEELIVNKRFDKLFAEIEAPQPTLTQGIGLNKKIRKIQNTVVMSQPNIVGE